MRRNVFVDGLAHSTGTPNLRIVGRSFWGAGVFGYDREASIAKRGHVFPDSIEEECDQMFANLRTILKEGHVDPSNVGRIAIQVTHDDYKAVASAALKRMYHSQTDRPISSTDYAAKLSYGRVRLTFEGALDEKVEFPSE